MGRILSRIEQAINDRIRCNTVSVLRGNYKKTAETSDYCIFEPCYGGKKVVAAFEEKIVLQESFNNKYIDYYPFVKNRLSRHRIKVNSKTFPGLVDGSSILKCMFIPFMRQISDHRIEKSVRLVVITDKGQIYHNFPARHKMYDGKSQSGDEYRFEESVVWDLPERKHPTKNKSPEEYEVYYPNLPDECYCFHPVLNTDPAFTDPYNNGGFGAYTFVKQYGADVKASRFYLYSHDVQANPFHYIGGGDYNHKMTIIGTYRSNVSAGVRVCIFATTDGGRVWNCKYEFGDKGEYEFRQGDTENWGHNFGNPIQYLNYENVNWHAINICQRTVLSPTEKCVDSTDLFSWNIISGIEKAEKMDDGQVRIWTKQPHKLATGNIIALTCGDKDKNKLEDMQWALNNSISANSGGTGVLFKIEVVDEYSFKLYEFVSSASNNITCRHIHHINRTRDGWIVGTGEIYPNSWLLYLQLKKSDTFSIVNSSDEFDIIRLNSSENSIQRTMGVLYLDDDEDTIIYASDHDDLNDECCIRVYNYNVSFSRNNTGIYKGHLNDINDRKKFTCIRGMTEPCFYFQKLDHYWLFCGQRGELGVSLNEGKDWKQERLQLPIIHYYGKNGRYFYFDSCVIQRKG